MTEDSTCYHDDSTCIKLSIKLLDVIVSITWITTLVVAVWRGTWNLLDLYCLPGDVITGTYVSYFGGIVICTAVSASYPYLDKNTTPDQKVGFKSAGQLLFGIHVHCALFCQNNFI